MPGLAYNSPIFALGSICLAACAGRSPQTDTADLYRQLRTAEAELERADLSTGRGDCADATTCATGVCGAADDVCRIAAMLAEADAALRCDAAQRRCVHAGGPGATNPGPP